VKIRVVIAGKRRDEEKDLMEKQRLDAEEKNPWKTPKKEKRKKAFLKDYREIKEPELERAKLKAIIADEKEKRI
jgi:hypothetical protein